MEIVVKKAGDKWGAFFQDKRIAIGKCRPCVVQIVLAVTKKSSRYKTVAVFNEDGSLYRMLPTGDGNGRTAAKDL